MGNPLSDGTWTYTWEHGRQLASMTDGTTTWTYTYDANGLRSKRTNGTDTYTYVYNGPKLVQMTKGSQTLYFTYDGSGNPSTVTLNGATYYYITNLQGDVIEIRSASGSLVCDYTYDAWGKVVTRTNSSNHLIDDLNPLLYRGYVYDHESGLYYLQSRYYNPNIGRFLNADALVSTGQGMLGNNMFAYCANNPVLYKDPSGFLRLSNNCVVIDYDNGVSGEETLAGYVNLILSKKGTGSDQKIGRILNKTIDAGAESMIENVDGEIFGAIIICAVWSNPLTVSSFAIAIASSAAMGFLYGSVRGFVDAVRDERD